MYIRMYIREYTYILSNYSSILLFHIGDSIMN